MPPSKGCFRIAGSAGRTCRIAGKTIKSRHRGHLMSVTFSNGEKVFESSCGTCHTLAAAGTTGTVGPNLDELKPSESTVEHQVINGGGKMPAFKGQLSPAEIKAVSKYVAGAAGT